VLTAAIAVVAVVVVVDARSLSASLDGVPGITVEPEPALDRRCCGPGPASAILILGVGVDAKIGRRPCARHT
jgi:hypothetical protein